MSIEDNVRNKFNDLIKSGEQLKHGNRHGQILGDSHRNSCMGWLASSQNIVHLIISDKSSPFRASVDKICATDRNLRINSSVGEITVILQSLLNDIDLGLIASIEKQAQATVFDDFLDHAKEYYKQEQSNESGVIAGVVFEDTLRGICRNLNIEEKGKKLDSLINELVKNNTLTQIKAKRARVAAHVRTKATHAQWDEFELEDVKTTIDFTEELIVKNFEQ